MIAIGSFQFPADSTVARVEHIEAKSKVRKEITIQSMIQETNDERLEEAIEQLKQSVELFDRHETDMSLQTGRYYQGRRRRLSITPIRPFQKAWVELVVLTEDPYERGLALRGAEQDLIAGEALFQLDSAGNWQTPIDLTLAVQDAITRLEIDANGRLFVLNHSIDNGNTISVDSFHRVVTVNGVNAFPSAQEPFPVLDPGSNVLLVRVLPQTAAAHCRVEYRDQWI